MTLGITIFYLNTPLAWYEYLRLKLRNFPDDVIEEYNLKEKATKDGFVYVEVRKGVYILPQSGLLAQILLEELLQKHGYEQSKITQGFWKHKWRPIFFTLVVDAFGVNYVGKEHARHLVSVLKEQYEISEDWKGKKYVGLTFDWDYKKLRVYVSMPGNLDPALIRFKHGTPRRAKDQPYQHTVPNYGARQHFAVATDGTALLDKDGKTFVHQVTFTFLYYSRAVDITMLVTLSAIALEKASPTENTMKNIMQFLDYAASQEKAVVTYHASDMVLACHSNAS